MRVNIKLIYEDSKIPSRQSEYAAGYDIFAYVASSEKQITINPDETKLINTGFSLELPSRASANSKVIPLTHSSYNYAGFIYARSGLAARNGISLANCVGVVDADYRGEVKVPLRNSSKTPFIIKNGDRIAQLIISKIEDIEFFPVNGLSDTKRQFGGFNSTGI